MPLKTHKHLTHKKHPKHYTKVYWPYLPLVLLISIGLLLGQPFSLKSQRDVLSYATNVSTSGLLSSTNSQRTNNSRSSLKISDKLSKAAQDKANDMAKLNYWSHNTPDGQEPWMFIARAGYDYDKAGENLAFGFANSTETVAGWMNSPTHKANLLDPAFSEVGFGIVNSADYQNHGPETIIVAMYGQPVTRTSAAGTLNPTNDKPVTVAPEIISISKAQALTGGRAPWIAFVLGALSGMAVVYLLIRHGIRLRRTVSRGEKYVLTHPIFDITIITLIAVCTLLGQNAGFIR